MQLGTLKAQDYFKLVIVVIVLIGSLLSSFQITTLNEILPLK
jgi:cytochrome bd-type quinol oxidase subunit 1